MCAVAWGRWWTRCLSAGRDPGIDAWSPAFVGDDMLAARVDQVRGPAITCSQAHREAAREGIHHGAMRQGQVIRGHLSKRGPVAPVTLRILVLREDSAKAWPVGPGLVILPD